MDSSNKKVAVVGAGVVGLCCAYRLQKQGYQVTLWDMNYPGHGCSKGNAGHFATEQVFPLGAPGLWKQIPGMLLDPLGPVAIRWSYFPRIAPWLMQFMWNTRQSQFKAGTKALEQLNEHSLPAWKRLMDEIGMPEFVKVKGSYLVFEQESNFLKYANDTLPALGKHGVKTEVLSGNELREKQPALSPDIKQAVFFPQTGHTPDPLKLSETVFNHYMIAGGLFKMDKVQCIVSDDSGVTIKASTQEHTFDQLILTTGAWSRPLVKQATGVSIPLDTERGYHMMLPSSADLLDVPVSSADRKFIMTPMDEGLRLAGTVEFGGLDAEPNMQRALMLEQQACALLPELKDRNEQQKSTWMGFRPSLPDSLPILDRVGHNGQVVLALAHQHLGLTQAALSAELVMDMLADNESVLDMSPFKLNRFQ